MSPPAIEPAVLAELFKLEEETGPGLVRGLVDLFVTGFPVSLEKMRKAVADGDGEALFLEAHAMKSSCGYLGAFVMRDYCIELEAMGSAGGTQGAPERIERLAAAFVLASAELRSRLPG